MSQYQSSNVINRILALTLYVGIAEYIVFLFRKKSTLPPQVLPKSKFQPQVQNRANDTPKLLNPRSPPPARPSPRFRCRAVLLRHPAAPARYLPLRLALSL